MWLINTTSLELELFMGTDIPPYAILSHTWANDEVNLREFRDLKTARLKSSFAKIDGICQLAWKRGIKYAWVDSCCIDKSSSAELSEAINSMYTWYRQAEICYVYMLDVSVHDQPHAQYPTVITFEKSRWFTRGWTLQELIAPQYVIFYSKEWQEIGTKAQLIEYLEQITEIAPRALEGANLKAFSIASKMSWAAKRITTRREDAAYSLLGLFDVNMPLLYGEGSKAFLRLQEEIMKISDDQSLLAWKSSSTMDDPYVGLLARSPMEFSDSANISSLGLWTESESFSMTSKGLRARLFLVPDEKDRGLYRARLECTDGQRSSSKPMITLQLVSVFDYGNQYVRVRPTTFESIPTFTRKGEYRTIYVRQDIPQLIQPTRLLMDSVTPQSMNLFWIRGTSDFYVSEPVPAEHWNSRFQTFGLQSAAMGRTLVSHSAGRHGNTNLSLLFGVWEGEPVCSLDDPQIFPKESARRLSDLSASTQCMMRKNVRGTSLFATAKVLRREFNGRPLFMIVLFVKTVQ